MLTLDMILSENRTTSSVEAHIRHAVTCSPFLMRLLNKDAVLLDDLLANVQQAYQLRDMQSFLAQQNIEDEASLKQVLRKLRQQVMARMIVRDLNGLADLDEVMRTTTQLAEISIQTAIQHLSNALEKQYGQPVNGAGEIQSLLVVGMGKLGGGELNVSSDIDLIFAYGDEGETQGPVSISNQEFFTRLGKKLIAAIDEMTADGFVFRVDMRLRPFGSEGALVSSLDALEAYYQNNGREWERYAWIKGRVIAGQDHQLEKLLKPFIYRKYLDYGAFASMRDLKIQIHRDVNTKGMQDNIKLGRGGIREIEFIAQVFQLIRGGRDASLQVKPTLTVLALLKSKGLLPAETADELTEAYIFLRNLEHRLMYVEDAQTQELPKKEIAQARIAKALNFSDWLTFLAKLNQYREQVAYHFDATFNDDIKTEGAETNSEASLWNGNLTVVEAEKSLNAIGYQDAPETWQRITNLHQSSRYLKLPELSRQRFDTLMPHVLALAGATNNAETTLLRMMDLLESICRRASYLALLAEHPEALRLLVKLCSASPWLANYLTQHPILLDELLDTRTLYAAPDFAALRQDLLQRLAEVEGDVERQMDVMRHFKHATIFRIAVQDLNEALQLEILSDYLSALADLILDVGLITIWPYVRGKHSDSPKFAVIGYGKLGGRELGYASDLDIIFLYDDDAPEAGEVYARFAQRINTWFNSLTSAGLLYETDLQLRPDGNSGLLVSDVSAFHDYQLHKAWVWEHQALSRARFVAGAQTIGQQFEQIRTDVMIQQRDHQQLKTDVLQMREKMREAQNIPSGQFDLKHSLGGIIDVEFLVQYLVLSHAAQHRELTQNIGNIALLKLLATFGIIQAGIAEKAVIAYREYRKMQHALKLQGMTHNKVDIDLVGDHANAVNILWQRIFSS